MKEFVEMRDVRKIYRMGEVEIAAADGIDFQIKKGEFAVVVGPSGAGKTTVLNILGGMDTATSGEVWIDGKNIVKYSPRQLTSYRRDDSFPVGSSRGYRLHVHWQRTRSFFCVMSRQGRWITIPVRQY